MEFKEPQTAEDHADVYLADAEGNAVRAAILKMIVKSGSGTAEVLNSF